jgi:hypothetical protein
MLIRNLNPVLVNGSRGVVIGWATLGSHPLPKTLPSAGPVLTTRCVGGTGEFEGKLAKTKADAKAGVDVRESPYRPFLHDSQPQFKWLAKRRNDPYFRYILANYGPRSMSSFA